MRNRFTFLPALIAGSATLVGCGPRGAVPPPQPVLTQHTYSPPVANVYDWHTAPLGQRIPVERAQFNQEGYQISTPDGIIVVPFSNQNLYVMKFAHSFDGQTYFVNQGDAPTLYLTGGFGLENTAAQGALWYPLPPNYQPQNPVYVGLAPSWSEYQSMGWYPGMTYYGGLVSPFYHPGLIFHTWTPGYIVNIGGRPYTNYRSYANYYRATPGYTRIATGGEVYRQPRAGRFVAHGYSSGTSGSGFADRPGTSGGFRTNRAPAFHSPGAAAPRPRSSFGGGAPAYRSTPRPGGSFGSGGAGGPRPRSSFGGGSGNAPMRGSGGFGKIAPSDSRPSGSFGRPSSAPAPSRPAPRPSGPPPTPSRPSSGSSGGSGGRRR